MGSSSFKLTHYQLTWVRFSRNDKQEIIATGVGARVVSSAPRHSWPRVCARAKSERDP